MKLIVLLLISFFASLSLAADAVLLKEITGTTEDGTECTYSVYRMDNWEGQTVVFLVNTAGNFRLELDSATLAVGNFTPTQSDVNLKFDKTSGSLTSVISGAADGLLDTKISILIKNGDILDPISAQASATAESYSCKF